MRIDAGRHRTAHQDDTSPSTTIVPRNARAYTADRNSDQSTSPVAMSVGRRGVAMTALYDFMYLNRTKNANVQSNTGPNIADVAHRGQQAHGGAWEQSRPARRLGRGAGTHAVGAHGAAGGAHAASWLRKVAEP